MIFLLFYTINCYLPTQFSHAQQEAFLSYFVCDGQMFLKSSQIERNRPEIKDHPFLFTFRVILVFLDCFLSPLSRLIPS